MIHFAQLKEKHRRSFRLCITLSVAFSKGLREAPYRITQMLERITNVQLRTETLIDDTLC